MEQIHYTQIQNIMSLGIVYVDNAGDGWLIDFDECYQKRLAPFISPEAYYYHIELNPDNHHETYEAFVEWQHDFYTTAAKVVGLHNRYGDKYERPHIKIDVDIPWLYFFGDSPILMTFDDDASFARIREQIWRQGWYTRDTS